MTRMTGSDCAVMCNLINTHTHTHKYVYVFYLLPVLLVAVCTFNLTIIYIIILGLCSGGERECLQQLERRETYDIRIGSCRYST